MGASDNPKGTTPGVAFARIIWMMIGPLVLAMLGFNIISNGAGWFTVTDVAYFIVLAVVLGARWLEFRSGQGQTAEGEPLTEAGLRRYLLLTALVGIGVWAGANLIGNHWLSR